MIYSQSSDDISELVIFVSLIIFKKAKVLAISYNNLGTEEEHFNNY